MKTPKARQKKCLFVAGLLALLGWPLLARAPVTHAENVVGGYSSKQTLTPGQVVALDKEADRSVKAAPAANSNLIYGVVVDPSDAPITLVGKGSKYFVATSGTYQVLASASTGAIKPGDYISMSSIDGIAAKASSSQSIILGKAESSFNGKTGIISSSNGVSIGRVFVNINIQKNPLAHTDPTLPSFLRKMADTVASRPVPVIRVYTALILFMISMIAAVTVLWSGVRSSLISLGRNPLSRHAIFSGMYKVVFTGLGVFIIGLAGVYLLLKV